MIGGGTFKQHYYYLKCAADRFRIPATVDMTTSIVKLSYPNTNAADALFPMFSKFNSDKQRIYNGIFETATDRFAGWKPMPVDVKGLNDKLELKQRLSMLNCLVPDYRESNNKPLTNVIVKQRISAFSQHIKGPFQSSQDYTLDTGQGEYFEQFVPGNIVKIWYVNNKPSCIDVAKMPTVEGDDSRRLRELLTGLINERENVGPEQERLKTVLLSDDPTGFDHAYKKALLYKADIQQLLAFQGYDLNSVLASNQTALAEFRYIHSFPRDNAVHWLGRCEQDFSALEAQLNHIGQSVYTLLLEESCPLLIYTVDAILDRKSQLWVLEANANPMMHPFAYEDLLYYLVQRKSGLC